MKAGSDSGGWLPVTPAQALGPTLRETVSVGGLHFILSRPDAVERLRDHPELGGASASEEYEPYWSKLWPAARMLAEVVLAEPLPEWIGSSPRALELGCGLGLPGLAALSRGWRVVFSDYDATALGFAADNARSNGFTDFSVLTFDWRQPPAELRVPLLLGADLVYQRSAVAPLAEAISRFLEPAGLCLIADTHRIDADLFRKSLTAHGLTSSGEPLETAVEGRRVQGVLYRIRHEGTA